MRNTSTRRLALSLAATVVGALLVSAPSVDAGAAPKPFVVVLRDKSNVTRTVSRVQDSLDVRPTQRYEHALKGFAAKLSPGQLRKLTTDPDVAMIAPDTKVELSAQVLPTGVNRVEADRSPAAKIDRIDGEGERVDVDIAIIDTGIQGNHPDLNVAGGVNCTGGDRNAWGDWNGHGTHVAGTAAALDNTSGVVGVAPGARLWAVRVFKDTTSSLLSWVVCGIDWVTAQNDPDDPSKPLIEVVNMSLRDAGGDDGACGTKNSDPEHAAICRSVGRGITYVVAAGNDRTAASKWRPASYNEVITVSALADFDGRPGGLAASTCSSYGQVDVDDTFADFSNYGSDVDLIAPGKCIRSTWRGSTYATLSGTSMASPAAAGGAALYKATHPDASPSQVRAALRAMGSYDWRYSTDPDGVADPLLDVSSIGAPPDFSFWLSGSTGSAWAGVDTLTFPIRVVRGNGFAGAVDLTVDGAPAGMTTSLAPATLSGLGGLSTTLTVTPGPDTPAGSYPLVVRGTSGELVHETKVSVTVNVDSAAPAVSAPIDRVSTGRTMGSTVAVRIAWGASDAGSGLELVELQESRDGGAWTKLTLPSSTAKELVRAIAFGHQYRYRVRARDRSGNVSDWVAGTSFNLTGHSEGAASFAGSWTWYYASSAWGGRTRYTRSSGASATYRFTGREVAVVAPMGSSRGWAKVYVDGTLVKRVNLYRSTGLSRAVVFERAWGTTAAHTVRIVNEATSGHPRLEIDGFIVKH